MTKAKAKNIMRKNPTKIKIIKAFITENDIDNIINLHEYRN